VNDEPQMPFGGTKEPGYGRSAGAIAEFIEPRWITIEGKPALSFLSSFIPDAHRLVGRARNP
jgi:hypothetical protein